MSSSPTLSDVKPRLALWDRIGIGLSGLCAVHCLLMPLVLATLPLWPGAYVVHAWVHLAFAVLLVPVTVLALRTALREGRVGLTPWLLGSGLALVLGAALAHDVVGEGSETVLTVLGSLLLIAGHWRNWQAHRASHRQTATS